MEPFSYRAAISLSALMATSRILGTTDEVVLKMQDKHFYTYLSPRVLRAIYFSEYIAVILKW